MLKPSVWPPSHSPYPLRPLKAHIAFAEDVLHNVGVSQPSGELESCDGLSEGVCDTAAAWFKWIQLNVFVCVGPGPTEF